MAAAAAAAGSIPHIHYTLAAMVGKEEAGRLCLSITPGGGGKLEKKTNNQRGKPQPNLRLVTTAFAFFSLSLSLSLMLVLIHRGPSAQNKYPYV